MLYLFLKRSDTAKLIEDLLNICFDALSRRVVFSAHRIDDLFFRRLLFEPVHNERSRFIAFYNACKRGFPDSDHELRVFNFLCDKTVLELHAIGCFQNLPPVHMHVFLSDKRFLLKSISFFCA